MNINLRKISTAGLLISLGIIYGDIGTSPLYVLKSIIGTRQITQQLVYGGISCVFWTLTLIFHYPEIIKALNPIYGFDLLVHYPRGFWLLGAVFLCTTGAEALYSDLGHCGRKNIRVSWIFVKITLILNYFGQGAWLMLLGKPFLNDLNPFYEVMPHGFLIFGILIATAATIIASQALISGSFTLINEAMRLNFWPKISVQFPTDIRGQIYIPSINWLLWIGCLAVMFYFRESSHMEAAYGFSITIAMLMTTILMFYYMKFIKKWHIVLISIILCVFLMVEISFFLANVAKIKQRWMFLVFEFGIIGVMYTWYRSRRIKAVMLSWFALRRILPGFWNLAGTKKFQICYSSCLYDKCRQS